LDLSEGSCLGTSQEKVREFGTGITRLREGDIPTAGAVWAIAEREWNTGGTKDSASHEVPRSELVWTLSREVPKGRDLWGLWQSIRWDRAAKGWTRVEFSHLGDSWTRRVNLDGLTERDCEVARLREALTLSLTHDFMW
jgi:hypothetical protein